MQRSAGRGRFERGGRGGRGRDQPQKFYSNVKIVDRDPGVDKTLFDGGSASAFVLVQQLMTKRAKAVRVWEIWTGKVDKAFFMRPPVINMVYDRTFIEPNVDVYDQVGRDLITKSAGIAAGADSPGGTNYPSGLSPFPIYYNSTRSYVGKQDAIYQYQQDEMEYNTGIKFGGVVVRTADPEDFTDHINKAQDRMLKWYSADQKHNVRVQLADATMRGCLGAGPLGFIKDLLDNGDIADVWEKLSRKYGAATSPWVIAELNEQLSTLRCSHPARLSEYFNRMAALTEALECCWKVIKTDEELAMLMQESLTATPFLQKTFESVFTNSRQNEWDLDRLKTVMQRESDMIVNKEGI
jgi:hypothetical protein